MQEFENNQNFNNKDLNKINKNKFTQDDVKINSSQNRIKTITALIVSTFILVLIVGFTAFAFPFLGLNFASSNSSLSSTFTYDQSDLDFYNSSSQLSATNNLIKSNGLQATDSSQSSSNSLNQSDLSKYVNPFFPKFELVYSKEWSFTTTTQKSVYKNLITRKNILKKLNYTLTISTSPLEQASCSGPEMPIESVKSFANGYKRFVSENKQISYSKSFNCNLENRITSTILVENNLDYKNAVQPEVDTVEYIVQIELTEIAIDDPLLKELDLIIENSSFN
jgi:hypothetical protein